jgi:plasmid stabilization system protein ParE
VSLPVVLRKEAQEEFDEAFDRYDAWRIGLGSKFLAAVEQVFLRISQFPRMHAIAIADVRKGVVRRFPYCVYYGPHADRIEVIAVFCTKRDPSIWHNRI